MAPCGTLISCSAIAILHDESLNQGVVRPFVILLQCFWYCFFCFAQQRVAEVLYKISQFSYFFHS